MIKLELGLEPRALKAQRDQRLPEAIKEFNQNGAASNALKQLLDDGYQVARDALFQRQFGKCAFCENLEDYENRPVEHFRPKKEAHDKGSGKLVVDATHYWWLTWTWSNLYFSCIKCNKNGNKGSLFPIEQGTLRSAAPTAPLANPIPNNYYDFSAEKCLLIEPRVDNPLEHLQWAPVDRRRPRAQWKWTIVGLSLKGDVSMNTFGLPDRIDRVNDHLVAIMSSAVAIDQHLQSARIADAREAFQSLVKSYVMKCEQPFRNAAFWALDTLYPLDVRQTNKFCELPEPSATERFGPWLP